MYNILSNSSTEGVGWTVTCKTSILQVCLWAPLRMNYFHGAESFHSQEQWAREVHQPQLLPTCLQNCWIASNVFYFFQCVLETPSSGHLESRWIYVQYPEALLAILYCRFQVCSVQLMLHDWTSNFSSKTFVWDPAIHYYARVDNSGQKPDSGVKPSQIGVSTMIQMNLVI